MICITDYMEETGMCSIQSVLNFKLVSLVKMLNARIEPELKAAGILYSDYAAMVVIYEHPGISQVELAQLKATDRTTIGHTIDKLEQLTYVERKRDLSDKRAYHLNLTGQGQRVVETFWEKQKVAERQALQNLSDSEIGQMKELLEKALSGGDYDE